MDDLPAGQGRRQLERQARAREAARRRRGADGGARSSRASSPDYGVAPPLHADGDWINTKPLTIAQLRGKVVLIDFWTYSCINCLRTLPHLKAWDATYRKQGLVIIGVHTPEFAFEHVSSNVRAAVKRLGIKYPVVQDNRFKTWDNYSNQYWPAEYLIDKTGHVRHTHFGEGQYGETEQLIRDCSARTARSRMQMADATPTGLLTPETYLGYQRLNNYVGTPVSPDASAATGCRLSCRRTPRLRRAVEARPRARDGGSRQPPRPPLPREERLHRPRRARHGARLDRRPGREDDPGDVRRSSTRCVRRSARRDATVDLAFTPGVQAYSFTFG